MTSSLKDRLRQNIRAKLTRNVTKVFASRPVKTAIFTFYCRECREFYAVDEGCSCYRLVQTFPLRRTEHQFVNISKAEPRPELLV